MQQRSAWAVTAAATQAETVAANRGFYPLMGLEPDYQIFDELAYVRGNPKGYSLDVGHWMNETLAPGFAADCAKYRAKCDNEVCRNCTVASTCPTCTG